MMEATKSISRSVRARDELTPREMDVLSLLQRGATNKEIQVILSISERTAENHVHSILQKLGVKNRTQAALYTLNHDKQDARQQLHSTYESADLVNHNTRQLV